MVNRRQYLTGTGALLTTGFAGCLGSSETASVTIIEDSPLFNSISVENNGVVSANYVVVIELSEWGAGKVDMLNMFLNENLVGREDIYVGQSKAELHPYHNITGNKYEIIGVSNGEYVDRIVFRVE